MKYILIFLWIPVCIISKGQSETVFSDNYGQRSAPYEEGILWWEEFAQTHNEANIFIYGETDAGYPLHIVTLSKEGVQWKDLKYGQEVKILINNAIHPGEPDGVDASMELFQDLLKSRDKKELLNNCILLCIPYYNIGGALNRNAHSRANQEGPEEYGFRGNAQNLDLNRDFIKCDSKNALSFAKLIQEVQPDIYVETHVSNGADYQYTMTYLPTQTDKLGKPGEYIREKMIPDLVKRMKGKDEEMCPYINIHGEAIKDRIDAFYDMPRYSTGMLALHQIPGFITETHMLKPFDRRVEATYKFLESILEYASGHAKEVKDIRAEALASIRTEKSFPVEWGLDTSRYELLSFKGYETVYEPSRITGAERYYYDRKKPVTTSVKYYNWMFAQKVRDIPRAYILSQGYWPVAERLKANGVQFSVLDKDTVIEVLSYKIVQYETVKNPYEKHYLHYNTRFEPEKIKWKFHKGDYIIPMNSDKNYFLAQVMEPDAPDSYFNWNFFDAVLQQKEWYSNYVFEDKAEKMLGEDPELKKAFEQKKLNDPEFRKNAGAQLYWLYQHSPYYEKEHLRIPIFRVENG